MGAVITALLFATALQLTSPAFKEGGTLSDDTALNGLDCHGRNISLPLEWRNAPLTGLRGH
jgi:phosphatidylethanolamine-binding protein (PEBP) family uncharacterized protein